MKPTYAALEQQLTESQGKLEKLAAENAGLLEFIKDDCWIYETEVERYRDAHDYAPQTQATSAFLAEVRASGVEMFALMFAEEAIKSNNITSGWRARASRAASDYADALREDADQLRQGGAV